MGQLSTRRPLRWRRRRHPRTEHRLASRPRALAAPARLGPGRRRAREDPRGRGGVRQPLPVGLTDVPRSADAVVVGGGVHGASVAYHLARRGGRRVVLVERKFLASGPTGRSSALVRRFYAMDFLTRTANLFRDRLPAVGGEDRRRRPRVPPGRGPSGSRGRTVRCAPPRERPAGPRARRQRGGAGAQRGAGARPRHGGRRRGARRLRAGVRVRGRRDDHERARHACPRAGGDDRPVRLRWRRSSRLVTR